MITKEGMKELTKRFIDYARTTLGPINSDEVMSAVQALCDFDFEKQERLMQFLDWKWLFATVDPIGGFDCRVPSKDEIIDEVIEHICRAYWKLDINQSESAVFKSGGFVVTVTKSNCTIEFIANSGHSL